MRCGAIPNCAAGVPGLLPGPVAPVESAATNAISLPRREVIEFGWQCSQADLLEPRGEIRHRVHHRGACDFVVGLQVARLKLDLLSRGIAARIDGQRRTARRSPVCGSERQRMKRAAYSLQSFADSPSKRGNAIEIQQSDRLSGLSCRPEISACREYERDDRPPPPTVRRAFFEEEPWPCADGS